MSAMTNIHRNVCHRPRSSVSERVPKVAMAEPLTARRAKQFCLCFRSAVDGGMTLTSAPVSIRKRRLELWSVRNNRRLGEWPATLVAESDWPSHFPLSSKVLDISWRHR